MLIRCIAAFLILGAAAFAQSQQPSSNNSQHNQPTQPSATDQRDTYSVPLTIKVVPPTKSEADIAKEEAEHREKYDLDRKLVAFNGKLADYTLWLVIVASLQFIVLLIQAIFLGNSVRIAKTTLRDVERAWMGSGPFQGAIEIRPNKTTKAFLAISNHGRTHGIGKELGIICFEKEPTSPTPKYEGAKIITMDTSFPAGQIGVSKWFCEYGSDEPFYCAGYFRYLDIFKKSHTSRWCTLIIPKEDRIEGGKGPSAWNEDD